MTPMPDVRARRRIVGMAAVLLPYTASGAIDWPAFEAHVARTRAAGLTPAVNMDTGYVQQLGADDIARVLDIAASTGEFVAGAFVADAAGSSFAADAYRRAADAVAERGGIPVMFPSHGLNALDDESWLRAHEGFGAHLDRFLGFELGPMFVPYGRIVRLDTYCGLFDIPQCIGAKHSSLARRPEWDRLARRDERRPDFMVLTGNGLAIDMVMYGSDYLLGLATFAPDVFAVRDRMWHDGDAGFAECNDLLQYLGQFAFRPPVPAYRHSAAMLLELQGWIHSDATPPGVPRRPDADRDVLADIVRRLEAYR